MSPWKVILATMVIFGCGVITGGMLVRGTLAPPSLAGTDLYAHEAVHGAPTNNPASPQPLFAQIQRLQFLKQMEKQLDLKSSQSDQIAKMMKESQERSRPMWKDLHQELLRVLEQIRTVLTPDQNDKLDELLAARQRANKKGLRPLPISRATNQ